MGMMGHSTAPMQMPWHGPRSCAATLALFLSSWGGAAAGPAEREPGPPKAWLALVARYASGERSDTIAALSFWARKDLDAVQSGLEEWREAARACPVEVAPSQPQRPACRSAERYRALPFRQAILLHTEKALAEQLLLPPDLESPHAPFARALVDRDLLPGSGDAASFVRDWYLCMVHHAHGEMLLTSATVHARAGLARLPDDPLLALALGTLEETIGSIGNPPLGTAPAAYDTRAYQAWLGRVEGHHERLQAAARALELALRSEPGLDEATVRLGRVRWRLGEPATARQALEQVVARSHDEHLLYLAWLFLGRVHEDAGRVAEAEAAYRTAATLDRQSQTARIALSHLLFAGGDEAAAGAALGEALAPAGHRDRPDGFWEYPWGRAREAETCLLGLRQAAAR
jgi:tetratricopeptide (TPR) repeat protein